MVNTPLIRPLFLGRYVRGVRLISHENYTTWKGSMAQLPCIGENHGPLQCSPPNLGVAIAIDPFTRNLLTPVSFLGLALGRHKSWLKKINQSWGEMVHTQVTFFPHPSMELSACTIWHAFIGPFSRKMARMMVLLSHSLPPKINHGKIKQSWNYRYFEVSRYKEGKMVSLSVRNQAFWGVPSIGSGKQLAGSWKLREVSRIGFGSRS